MFNVTRTSSIHFCQKLVLISIKNDYQLEQFIMLMLQLKDNLAPVMIFQQKLEIKRMTKNTYRPRAFTRSQKHDSIRIKK